jgi:glycerophosphoryl diester phosphodiesterase
MIATILCLLPMAVHVIAHRGEHLNHPENTLPAYRAAIEAGADFFELDVRTTSDGRLVLMHDARVDRTTDGAGELSRMSFDEIRSLDAGVRRGNEFRGVRVPTFTEALELAKGRCGVYVDIKQARAEDIVREVRAAGMERHSVFYGGLETLAVLHRLEPEWRVMPEAVSLENLEGALALLAPKVVAFDARDFTDALIARAKRAGALVFVDRLGPLDRPAAWEEAIQSGADGIQTDHPAELARFLRSRE